MFKDSVIRHHGHINTQLKQVPDIVQKAKIALVEKLPDWQQSGENVIEFEIYNENREIIYTWKK